MYYSVVITFFSSNYSRSADSFKMNYLGNPIISGNAFKMQSIVQADRAIVGSSTPQKGLEETFSELEWVLTTQGIEEIPWMYWDHAKKREFGVLQVHNGQPVFLDEDGNEIAASASSFYRSISGRSGHR